MAATISKYKPVTAPYAAKAISPSRMAQKLKEPQAATAPASSETPVKSKRVTIYGAPYCKPCKAAKQHFSDRGVEVRFVDIDEDENGFNEMASKLAAIGIQPGTIPVIELDGKLMLGFDAAPDVPAGAEVVEAATGKSKKKPDLTVSIKRKPKEKSSSLDWRYPATVGIGVVGGASIGYWAFEHAFKVGMSRDEKRQIAGFSLAMSVLYLTSQMPWGKWFNVETAGEELDKVVAEAIR